ncbi:MAG: glycosyltransferase family 2 protein [Bacteroidota bacterium]
MKPSISIIMATYNRAHLITESLATIQNQTYRNWECLIIDDGSSDGTGVVVDEFINKDSRFNYHKRTEKYKKGLPGCRNQGLDLAKGNYIIFFDDDDIVHPENLQTCIKLLRNEKFYFVRYDKKPFIGNSSEIEIKRIKNSNVIQFGIRDLDNMVTGKVPFASCGVLWNRSCFAKDRFNEELMYAEEWECYSRILAGGFEGLSTDSVLYFNRKHKNSNTGEYRRKKPIRMESQEKAALMVIKTLSKKSLFNENLKVFFLRMGFELKSFPIIQKALEAAKSGVLEIQKYKLGYKIYPLLKPVFYLKGKIKNS